MVEWFTGESDAKEEARWAVAQAEAYEAKLAREAKEVAEEVRGIARFKVGSDPTVIRLRQQLKEEQDYVISFMFGIWFWFMISWPLILVVAVALYFQLFISSPWWWTATPIVNFLLVFTAVGRPSGATERSLETQEQHVWSTVYQQQGKPAPGTYADMVGTSDRTPGLSCLGTVSALLLLSFTVDASVNPKLTMQSLFCLAACLGWNLQPALFLLITTIFSGFHLRRFLT